MAMLNDFSSLFEVITAAYFSMCIDDVLKEVWTPEYKKQVINTIRNSNVALANRMVSDFENYVDSIVVKIRKLMKIRSMLMLLMCLTILIIIGFEEKLTGFGIDESELIVRFSILVLLSQVFSKLLLCKFSRAVLTTIGIWCVTLISFRIDFKIECPDTIAMALLLFTFMWPIFWQIIRCWATSSLYYGYLKEGMSEENHLYDLAMLGFRTDKIDVVPECYKESVVREIECAKAKSKHGGDSDDKVDSTLQFINKKFISRMELICKHTNTLYLIWMDIKFHFNLWFGLNKKESTASADITDRVFKNTTASSNQPLFDEHQSIKGNASA